MNDTPETKPSQSLDLSGYTQVTDPAQLSDGADTLIVLQGVSEAMQGALLVHGVTDSLGIPTRCMGDAVPLAVVYQRPVQWLTGDELTENGLTEKEEALIAEAMATPHDQYVPLVLPPAQGDPGDEQEGTK